MGEKIEQIERHIQKQRHELGDNISELEKKVKGAFDWRTQFEERPAVLIGAAFFGGALLAAILPKTSAITSRVTSRRRSFSDPWAPYANRDVTQHSGSSEYGTSSPSYAGLSDSASKAARKTSETWENLKGAVAGLAVSRITEFVEELVPGFTEHYKKAASGQPVNPFSSTSSGSEGKSWQKANGGTDYASHS